MALDRSLFIVMSSSPLTPLPTSLDPPPPEWIDGGSLLAYYKKKSNPLTTEQAIAWLHQSAQGMAYLHEQGIAHRDLKAANIMVLIPPLLNRLPALLVCSCLQLDNGVAVVTDFGLSKNYLTDMLKTLNIGTQPWMAPGPYSPLLPIRFNLLIATPLQSSSRTRRTPRRLTSTRSAWSSSRSSHASSPGRTSSRTPSPSRWPL